MFDLDAPDFPAVTLPSAATRLPRREQQDLLAAAWIAYNEVVIEIERKYVLPGCARLLDAADLLEGLPVDTVHELVEQTAIDEHFHILGSLQVVRPCRQHRNLDDFQSGGWPAASSLDDVLTAAHGTGLSVSLLAMAFTFEASVTYSFYVLGRDDTIQPLHSQWTRLHWSDERHHSHIFRSVFRHVYSRLDPLERELFRDVMDATLDAMFSGSGSMWLAVLAHFGMDEPIEPTLLGVGATGHRRVRTDLRRVLALDR